MYNKFNFLILFAFLVCFAFSPCQAQVVDSTQTTTEQQEESTTNQEETVVKKKGISKPVKAALMSAIIPGTGQLYVGHLSNWKRGYWKTPIIWGLVGFLGYNVINYNQDYQSYKSEAFVRDAITFYEDQGDDQKVDELEGQLNPEYENQSTDQVKTNRDQFRQVRDLNGVLLFVTYVLNIFDAYVDVHLLDFRVGNDYLMSVRPQIRKENIYAPPSYGLGITINAF